MATHSESRKICLYRVHIKWDPAQWDPSQMKQSNSSHSFPTPSFQFVHSKVETPSAIFHKQKNPTGDMNDIGQPSDSVFCLTHLDIITALTDNSGSSTTAPFIMGVFSVPVHALDSHHFQQNGSSSVIVRWQLDTTAQDLHASFDDVVSKKSKIQVKVLPAVLDICHSLLFMDPSLHVYSQQKTGLRRLEDFHSDRFVVSIDQIESGNVLAVTYDDSSISFLNPTTMKNFDSTSDENTVIGMAQIGFNFPIDISGNDSAISILFCLRRARSDFPNRSTHIVFA